jgi:hypothetical protein
VALSNVTKGLWAVAAAGFLISASLSLRTAIEVNKRLPPEKRIPLFELRERGSDVDRFHGEFFPMDRARTTANVIAVVSSVLVAIGIIVEIAK